ncbi:Spore germination protein A1 [Paenibacillus allorhizoplanae]|uniref:Spore germination protein A1 n=1 Tax=Paenibacillus allorhizoplanae TaxID=2905648 RepID=A0ABN8G5U7_9BACL|nr:spore germination protein [Paenibacillus allorhizoplanae]CAH1196857.1 Spore germination protein A1 [Paenibacillus allorhizoplanae]
MSILTSLKYHFEQDRAYISRQLWIGSDPLTFLGLRTLVNFPRSLTMVRDQLHTVDDIDQPIQDRLSGLGHNVSNCTLDELISEILDGMLIAIHEPSGTYISIIPVAQPLNRSVTVPLTENVVRGSSSAFNEDIELNVGLLRKHINSSDLQIATYRFGEVSKNCVVLSYLNTKIDPRLLRSIIKAIETNLHLDVSNVQELSKMFGFSNFTLVTRYNTTELPQSAARALKNGKAVIFIERLPFALILPSLVSDLFVTADDANHPQVFAAALSFIRIIGALITLIIPGLYVALVSVNPDVLRFELAHSIAKSRIDVPYPAIVETLLLLFVLELTLEAIVRLPPSIGPTITMVGGIVLGQAVVSAKLVSSLLIIVLAATTISSATVVGFQSALTIRLFKYVLLILSAIFGVLGLLFGIVIICSYLAGVKSLGVPYLQLKNPEGE